MRIAKKTIILVELLLILGLLFWVFMLYHDQSTNASSENVNYSLLSPRINANLLQPNSYLVMNYDPLEEEFRTFIEQNNLSMSIYVENMRDGAAMSINGHRTYLSGSMGKLPIAIMIMERVQRGELSLDTNLSILEEDKDSYSGNFYQENVTEAPVSLLLSKMLQESDNTALYVLVRNTDPNDYVLLLEKYYGYYDQSLPDEDTENVVNPISMYNMYSSLYLSTVLDAENSQYLLELLSNTTFPIHEIAQIPSDVIIAQKYGVRYDGDNQYFHDCGIMYIDDMRVFYCIMTEDLDPETGELVVGQVVNRIYTYSLEKRDELDEYAQNNKT